MRVVSWASSPGMKLETRRYASYSVPGRVASWEPLCALRYLRSLFFFSLHLASFSMPSSIFSSLFYFFIFWGDFLGMYKNVQFLQQSFALWFSTQSYHPRRAIDIWTEETIENPFSCSNCRNQLDFSRGCVHQVSWCEDTHHLLFFLLFLNFSSGHHLYTILLYSFHLFQVDIKGE